MPTRWHSSLLLVLPCADRDVVPLQPGTKLAAPGVPQPHPATTAHAKSLSRLSNTCNLDLLRSRAIGLGSPARVGLREAALGSDQRGWGKLLVSLGSDHQLEGADLPPSEVVRGRLTSADVVAGSLPCTWTEE